MIDRLRSSFTLACVLVLALACSGDADFSDAIETATLDVGVYKSDIETIDRLAFAKAPIDDARRAALANRFETLALRVAKEKPKKFMTLESLELRRLGVVSKRIRTEDDLTHVATNWIRIRSNLFDDQWWFARSADDLEHVESAGTTAIASRESEPAPAPAFTSPSPRRYVPLEATGDVTAPQGIWSARDVYQNGSLTSDAELSGSRWTFAGGELLIEGNGPAQRFACNASGGELRLRALGASDGAAEGTMLYRQAGDVMHVAFNDNLTGRPEGFAPRPGGEPPLVIVVLTRIDSDR